ncbi:MAG: hypothetical protein ACI4GZ_06255 [Ruminococcus sp.]
MMKILFLYYDIMNLYGENGNVRMIERLLRNQGKEVEVVRKTVTDREIDFTEYSFIYCGAGTERSRDASLEHLRGFRQSLSEAYEKGTVMLFTGNSYEMLGKEIVVGEKKTEGINLFDFTVSEQRKVRFSADVTFKCRLCEGELIGYINKCSEVEGIKNPLFEIEQVVGTVKTGTEGIHEKNFFGTQIIGPILIKNPAFANYIVNLID